jgi:23S rRNA-/tRNA-specific pseudouridylate synthase
MIFFLLFTMKMVFQYSHTKPLVINKPEEILSHKTELEISGSKTESELQILKPNRKL